MFVIIFIRAADSGPRLTIVTNAPVPANIIRRDEHGAAVLAAGLHTSAGTSASWRQRRFSAQIFPVRTLREFKITRQ